MCGGGGGRSIVRSIQGGMNGRTKRDQRDDGDENEGWSYLTYPVLRLWTRVSSLPLKKMVLGGETVCRPDTTTPAASRGDDTVQPT